MGGLWAWFLIWLLECGLVAKIAPHISKQSPTDKGRSMALPIWANYMRSCYALEALGISKDDFVAPEDLTIEVECEPIVEEGVNRFRKIHRRLHQTLISKGIYELIRFFLYFFILN